ncbi:MAG TPA: hypothetical protein PK079_09875 [Leptospiraceae bacterium]|nr:hypothetical protein [Leptospiraceae bacterium]HMW04719.1 hypothetical protein [Leptospiraceae bacterium]HMX31750.1 hypothetical protein [Leptospiraceae bacterium]HMY30556.1 hypothetical protein [Leptospiraceae bacterium]HMZ64143.1 hypothetical protein [Leptospiraceae bacterium]
MAKILSLFLFILFIHCFTDKIQLKGSVEEDRKTLLKHIPIGSSIPEAIRILKQNDFECSIIEKGEFLEERNINFIYCNHYEMVGLFISRRWQIAILLKKEKVDDIHLTTGLLGP